MDTVPVKPDKVKDLLPSDVWLKQFLACTDFESRKKLREQAIDIENYNRKLFAQFKGDPDIKDPYTSLLSVYHTPALPAYKTLNVFPEEKNMPVVMKMETLQRPAISIVDKEEFLVNWRVFTENSLQFLDWSNVFAAGGSVLACIADIPKDNKKSPSDRRLYFRNELPGSDIDLFIYGLDEVEAKKKMEKIYDNILDAIPYEVKAIRTPHAVTIISQYPYRHIQIVLRLYSSPAEILTGFDVDPCAVGFNGENVFTTRRAMAAILTRSISIDMTRRSPSYEVRLAKYADRGYEIHVPGLDRTKIDPQLYERSFDKAQGLSRLLLFEALRGQGGRLGFKEKQRERKLRPPHENAGGYNALQYARRGDLKSQGVDSNDYESVFIPYGPEWNAARIIKKAHRKDYMLNHPQLMSQFRSTRHHQHPLFYGTMKDVLTDCCGSCPPVPPELIEDDKEDFVSGPLTFLVDDPGRQDIGSFHPITDEDWAEGALVPDNLMDLLQAITKDDTVAIGKILDTNSFDVDNRDWVGRTPFLLAVFCNSIKSSQYLITRGAKLSATLPDGRNAFHICSEYGYSELLNILLDANRVKKEEAEERAKALEENQEKGSEEEENQEEEENEDEEEEEEDEDNGDEDDEEGGGGGKWKYVKMPPMKSEAPVDVDEEDEDEEEDDVIDLQFKDWDMKMTPLHFACFHGQLEIVEILLNEIAVENEEDEVSKPPATTGVWPPVTTKVTKAKAARRGRVVNSTPQQCSLLQAAFKCVDEDKVRVIVKMLLDAGESLLETDDNRSNIFHHLALTGDMDQFKFILSIAKKEEILQGLNDLNSYFKTPLTIAASTTRKDFVKFLLTNGASPNITLEACQRYIAATMHNDYYMRSTTPELLMDQKPGPLEAACQCGNHEIAALLIAAGANVNVKSVNVGFSTLFDQISMAVSQQEAALASAKYIPPVNEEFKAKQIEMENAAGVKNIPSVRDAMQLNALFHLQTSKPGSWDEFVLRAMINEGPVNLNPAYVEEKKSEPIPVPDTVSDDDVKIIELCKNDGDDVSFVGLTPRSQEARIILQERVLRRSKLTLALLVQAGAKTFSEAFPLIEIPPHYKGNNFANMYGINNYHMMNPSTEDPLHCNWNINPAHTVYGSMADPSACDATVGAKYHKLFEAVWNNDLSTVRRMCLRHPKEQQVAIAACYDGMTPLAVALYRGHHELAKEIFRIAVKQRELPTAKISNKGARANINNYESIQGGFGHGDEEDDYVDEEDIEIRPVQTGEEEEEEEASINIPGDDDDDTKSVFDIIGAKSPSSLLDFVGSMGGSRFTWNSNKASGSVHLGDLSPLELLILKGDVVGARVYLNIVVQAAAREAQFRIAAHEAGETLALMELKHHERALNNTSLFTGLGLLHSRGQLDIQPNYLQQSIGARSLLGLAILADNPTMIDFLLTETLGLIDLSAYAVGLVKAKKAPAAVSPDANTATPPVVRKGHYIGIIPPSQYVTPNANGFVVREVEDEDENEAQTKGLNLTSMGHFALPYGSFETLKLIFKKGYIKDKILKFANKQKLLLHGITDIDLDPNSTLVLNLSDEALDKIEQRLIGIDSDYLSTLLHACVRAQNIPSIKFLGELIGTEKIKSMAVKCDAGGLAPIHIAADIGTNTDLLLELLSPIYGGPTVALSTVDTMKGWTIIHRIVNAGLITSLMLVLSACDKNLLSEAITRPSLKHKHTALMVASSQGRHQCIAAINSILKQVNKLDEALAEVDGLGLTSLRTAIRTCKVNTTNTLLGNPKNIDEKTLHELLNEDFTGMNAYGTAIQNLRMRLRASTGYSSLSTDFISTDNAQGMNHGLARSMMTPGGGGVYFNSSNNYGQIPVNNLKQVKIDSDIIDAVEVYKIIREAIGVNKDKRVVSRRNIVPFSVVYDATEYSINVLDGNDYNTNNAYGNSYGNSGYYQSNNLMGGMNAYSNGAFFRKHRHYNGGMGFQHFTVTRF